MSVQWQLLLNILPPVFKTLVDRQGWEDLQEVRLRCGSPPELVKRRGTEWLNRYLCTKEDIAFCINTATKYSPWTSHSIAEGFITAPGGHRIGICGECVRDGNAVKNINHVSSVCIRVARQYPGIAAPFYSRENSILIIGRPGSGKTTFLRDLLRGISDSRPGSVSVIDERREIFPFMNGQPLFEQGKRTDVLSGCRKADGIEMALRCMSPTTIAMDEITRADDSDALVNGAWCGVQMIATAHAGSREDLYARPVYEVLLKHHIFQTLIVLHPDKTWQEEKFI